MILSSLHVFVFNQRNFTLVTYCGSPYLRSLSMNHKKEKRRSNYIKIYPNDWKAVDSMKIGYTCHRVFKLSYQMQTYKLHKANSFSNKQNVGLKMFSLSAKVEKWEGHQSSGGFGWLPEGFLFLLFLVVGLEEGV